MLVLCLPCHEPEPRTAAASKNKKLSTADCAEQNKAWLLAHNTQQCLWGGRGGGFTNMAWWHGPEIIADNRTDHFPACSHFFKEKEQLSHKIYLVLVCKEDCSPLKPAIHTSTGYLHEIPISVCFPHAYGAINLHTQVGISKQGLPGFCLRHAAGFARPGCISFHDIHHLSKAAGSACFSRGKLQMLQTMQCCL